MRLSDDCHSLAALLQTLAQCSPSPAVNGDQHRTVQPGAVVQHLQAFHLPLAELEPAAKGHRAFLIGLTASNS